MAEATSRGTGRGVRVTTAMEFLTICLGGLFSESGTFRDPRDPRDYWGCKAVLRVMAILFQSCPSANPRNCPQKQSLFFCKTSQA